MNKTDTVAELTSHHQQSPPTHNNYVHRLKLESLRFAAMSLTYPFSAFTLLEGRQEGHLVCEKLPPAVPKGSLGRPLGYQAEPGMISRNISWLNEN